MNILQNVQQITIQKTTGYAWLHMCNNAHNNKNHKSKQKVNGTAVASRGTGGQLPPNNFSVTF